MLLPFAGTAGEGMGHKLNSRNATDQSNTLGETTHFANTEDLTKRPQFIGPSSLQVSPTFLVSNVSKSSVRQEQLYFNKPVTKINSYNNEHPLNAELVGDESRLNSRPKSNHSAAT